MGVSVEVESTRDDAIKLRPWIDLDVGAEFECWCKAWILACFGS